MLYMWTIVFFIDNPLFTVFIGYGHVDGWNHTNPLWIFPNYLVFL